MESCRKAVYEEVPSKRFLPRVLVSSTRDNIRIQRNMPGKVGWLASHVIIYLHYGGLYSIQQDNSGLTCTTGSQFGPCSLGSEHMNLLIIISAFVRCEIKSNCHPPDLECAACPAHCSCQRFFLPLMICQGSMRLTAVRSRGVGCWVVVPSILGQRANCARCLSSLPLVLRTCIYVHATTCSDCVRLRLQLQSNYFTVP